MFGSIEAMVVWLDKKEITLLLHGETLDLPAGLFVHDIQLYYVTFSLQKLNFLYASKMVPSSMFAIDIVPRWQSTCSVR